MTNEEKLKDYDSEPVHYCANCYSLKIGYQESINMECCMTCGGVDIRTSSIQEWENLYKRRYGHPYVVKRYDPTKSIFFQLSTRQLLDQISKTSKWKEIILFLYPKFPTDLGREDSIMLLFDYLIKDNRLDDLKILLYHLNNKN